MKFFKDLLITLTGLVLLISSLFTILTVVAYFQGASVEDTLWFLKFTTPVMLISLAIAWRERNVFTAMFNWMFPGF